MEDKEKFKDFLGQELNIGDTCIRGNKNKYDLLEVCEILDFRFSTNGRREWKEVKILTKGNTKAGWTFPKRLYKIMN